GATLGFKSMKTAYATIKGIEVMRALRKGQASAFYYGDPLGEMGSVAKIVKLEHAWRRLDGRNDDGFQVAPFPG
ncbi:hypothetical protein QTP15_33370, partial [Klebsiella oxytoca]|nr:hypothetical protein [Klebsiella oxytoca]